jgi:phosphate transport system substrate-binding protein
VQLPDDLRVSLTNAPGQDAYPISVFRYLLVSTNQRNEVKRKAVASLLLWAVHEGQQEAQTRLYAPLPPNVVEKADALIKNRYQN